MSLGATQCKGAGPCACCRWLWVDGRRLGTVRSRGRGEEAVRRLWRSAPARGDSWGGCAAEDREGKDVDDRVVLGRPRPTDSGVRP